MKNEKKPGLLYRLFNAQRNDIPDAPEEDTTPTVKRYFKLLKRRFWKLISLNLMMLPMILPIVLILYLYLGNDKTPIENNPLFSQLYGAGLINPSVQNTMLLDLFGLQLDIPIYSNTTTYVLMGVCAVFLLITFGWQNAGAAYVLRSMVRGDAVFLFSDYFYAVRRNLKQGFFMGLIDVIVIFLLGFDIMYFAATPSSFGVDLCYFALIAIAVIYFFMRFYIYLLMVTFDLSIRKILKNALIFTMLGIKRNLMAVLGVLVITALNVVLFPLFAMTPLGIAIPLILPFLYYLAVVSFTTTYAAYPIIDRYMIAPYQNSADTEEYEEDEAEETEEN